LFNRERGAWRKGVNRKIYGIKKCQCAYKRKRNIVYKEGLRAIENYISVKALEKKPTLITSGHVLSRRAKPCKGARREIVKVRPKPAFNNAKTV
jgi:hypothetical protein